MGQLKAGHVSDLADSMAEAIENAMQQEWQTVKGQPLSAIGKEDREILFVAIARGVLGYLKAHQSEVYTSITLNTGAGPNPTPVTDLQINTGDV